MARQIDIHVKLNPRIFRRYCAFDTFRRQRRWYWPVLIAMVLITASLAGLLGLVPMLESASGLLMGLGIAIPMVVFGLYVIQVEAQISAQKLKQNPAVYSLFLSADGVRVVNDQRKDAPVDLGWEAFLAAFRRSDCIYLYVSPERALILPDGQASVSTDALWVYLKKQLGDERCVEKR